MNWDEVLHDGEKLQWQGRPAPRCFTFRNWKHSVFGILFLMVATFWQAVGMQLAAVYEYNWLSWLPIPFVLLGFYLSLGHVLLARIEWEQVFYAVSDRRVLVRRGLRGQRLLTLDLAAVTYFQLRPQGEELATLRIHGDANTVMVLNCIEYPRRVASLLETALGEKNCRLPEAGHKLSVAEEKIS